MNRDSYVFVSIFIRSRSQWAVEKAKENIEKHYAFVGILEELDDSLQLMEILIPRYFNKAKSVYKNPVQSYKFSFSNSFLTNKRFC